MLNRLPLKQVKSAWLLLSIYSLVIVVVQLLSALPASAKDCVYEGRTYSPGTVRGPYVCMPDGTWSPNK
jgi:hypothetical protein